MHGGTELVRAVPFSAIETEIAACLTTATSSTFGRAPARGARHRRGRRSIRCGGRPNCTITAGAINSAASASPGTAPSQYSRRAAKSRDALSVVWSNQKSTPPVSRGWPW